MNAPKDNRLRLVPTPHDEIDPCGQLVQMGSRWSGTAWQGHAGIPVAPFLIILRGYFVSVGEGLVGVDYDEV